MFDMFTINWLDYLTFIIVVLTVVYLYLTKNFQHFKKSNIPYETPHLIFGSLTKNIFNLTSIYDFSIRIYNRAKKNGLSGIFVLRQPILILGNPEMVKLAMVKDFDHFMDHRTMADQGFLSKNLFALKGQKWKNMRNTLSPAFTSSKLHFIFELIEKCADQINQHLLREVKKVKSSGQKDILIKVDVKNLFTRFTNDAIATAAFGIEVDSLAEPENEFYLMGKDLSDLSSGIYRSFRAFTAFFVPFLFKTLFKSNFFSVKASNYFTKLLKDNLKKRRQQKIVRPDMLYLLMEAQKNTINQEDFTDEDIIAQALLFFFAGFDAISTTLAITLHQLAEFPEVQEKLFQEIDKKLQEHNGKITYDILIKDMPYLNMVFDESQRRYPPGPTMDRICTKRYTFPAENDRPEYTINPGEQIWVPINGFHHDPEYFPEPEKFIPERWADESKHNLNAYMPFGIGPRICIANRFAKMETKLALFYFLKNHKVEFIKETQNPPQYVKMGLPIPKVYQYWLGVRPRY